MMDSNSNMKRVSDPKPILGATLVRISKDPARSSKEPVFKSSKEPSKSSTIDPSRRSSYPSLSNVHPERTSKEFTKSVKEPMRSSQDPLRSSSKVPVRPSEDYAKVRDERGRELLVKSVKKPTLPMGIKDLPKPADDNRRESLLFKSVKKPEMMGTKESQIAKDNIRRDSLIKSVNKLPMTSGTKDSPKPKNDNGNNSLPKIVAKQEITGNRDSFKAKDNKGRETSSKSFLKPHASGLKDVREVKREEGRDVLSKSISKQPMSGVKDSSRPKGDGGRDFSMTSEKKPQVYGFKDSTKERDGTGRDPLIKSEKKPQQVVGSKGSIKGIDGTGRDLLVKSEKKPQVIGIKDLKAKDDVRKIKVLTNMKHFPGVKQNDVPVRTVLKTDSPSLKTTSKVMNGGSSASKGTTVHKVVTKSSVKAKEEKRTKKVFSLPGQRFEAPEEDCSPSKLRLDSNDSGTDYVFRHTNLHYLLEALHRHEYKAPGYLFRLDWSRWTLRQPQWHSFESNLRNVVLYLTNWLSFVCWGYFWLVAHQRDALRLFYASLHSQIPESEMANIWMMEHGLLPADEAKWVLSRKQSSKGSMPLKPAAYKPSPTKVSNGRPAGNKPLQKVGTGQNVDMKPLGKKRKEEGADEKLPPMKKLKV